MKFFILISSIIVLAQVGIGIGGIIGVNYGSALGCINGVQWEYKETFGNVFELLHLLVIIAYCILALQVLLKIPRRTGIFDEPDSKSTLLNSQDK